MTLETCGWWIIPFAFFLFLIFLIKERNWNRAASGYVILSIPIIQILAFLANPPHVSALPPLFIAWFVILVLPTSRNYWIYIRWNRILMYEVMGKQGLMRRGVPIPLLMAIGGISALEGAWFLSGRWSLVLLWIWGIVHLVAILNRKLEQLAIFTLRYLPLISAAVYITQCANYLSIIYGGSILASWIFVINVKREQTKGHGIDEVSVKEFVADENMMVRER